MAYFPAFIELSGRPVLIVGGGAVAARKAERVRAAGAAVTVVAPRLAPSIAAMDDVRAVPRRYRREDVDGMSMVFACTDDPGVQEAVVADAHRAGALVCRTDDGVGGDFLTGATLARGAVQVAVTTSGKSPVLAAWIRERLEDEVGQHYGELAELMAELREGLERAGAGDVADRSRALLAAGLERDLALGRTGAARAAIAGALAEDSRAGVE